MKLLSTIAAVLISISAFSQNYVEYNEGAFSTNGEELSMEQINDLTLRLNVGVGNLRRGNRFNHMYYNVNDRLANNSLNGLGGIVSGVPGGFFVLLGGLSAAVDYDPEYKSIGSTFLVAGTGLCVISFTSFYKVSSKEGCSRKRDKEFRRVAEKLNEAIQLQINK